ncbi:MAG TPA: hypothetical protein VG407_03055 [Caulobacteraceae bacterium]|jgi:hypothetical protein|nr:hypothetical protein [Caulobacteraceae bacterium]
MTKAISAVLVATALSVGAISASAQDDAARAWTRQDIVAEVRIADSSAERLRARARFPDDLAKAQVRVLLSWGSGVDYETSIVAYREGVARWRIEHVYNGGNLGAYSRGMVTATTSFLSPEAGAELDTLVRDPALYQEPFYAEGNVPIGATISIRFEKRAHDAVFSGAMPQPNLTGRIIDILDEKNTDWLQQRRGAH